MRCTKVDAYALVPTRTLHPQLSMQHPTARLIDIGDDQAVQLPAEFRLEDTTEVYIRHDESTSDVILSKQAPVDWRSFMRMREQLKAVPQDFLSEREQGEQQRDPVEDWKE